MWCVNYFIFIKAWAVLTFVILLIMIYFESDGNVDWAQSPRTFKN